MKGDYEGFHALRRRKNKPNSKPNKANRRASPGNPKFEFRNPKRAEWVLFEKTNPIFEWAE